MVLAFAPSDLLVSLCSPQKSMKSPKILGGSNITTEPSRDPSR